ncbi:hypothetical protein B0H16DRAFT_1732966 [Mycena metata]|uniref:Uncharacterized protein n=1 Tax=Mycena metata TaxID=1033252 RepID=A0AAD7I0C8_9AGAR|nr:hypothetical protein B0H16DRAFT_1732966 [Mycena metata]
MGAISHDPGSLTANTERRTSERQKSVLQVRAQHRRSFEFREGPQVERFCGSLEAIAYLGLDTVFVLALTQHFGASSVPSVLASTWNQAHRLLNIYSTIIVNNSVTSQPAYLLHLLSSDTAAGTTINSWKVTLLGGGVGKTALADRYTMNHYWDEPEPDGPAPEPAYRKQLTVDDHMCSWK